MEKSNDYHISFFKPTTPQAVANRNMVIWLVLIWFVAIFGFQILLRVLEKPTPEPAYLMFQNVWEDVKNESANQNEIQDFGKATLSVLGKIALGPDEKKVLDRALSWSVYQLTVDSLRLGLVTEIREFEELRSQIENISNPEYIEEKRSLASELSPLLNLSRMDVRSNILPLSLTSENITELNQEIKNALPGIMEKYLVHNQSFLTNAKFLGFPFHYFYTAILLLILFVGLCWLYCVKTDKLNAKLNIID